MDEVMSTIPLFLLPILIYGVPVILGISTILYVMGKKFSGDLLLYSLVPICFWLFFFLLDNRKSLSNVAIEPFILGVFVCGLVATRFALENHKILVGRPSLLITTVFSSLLAAGVYFLMPDLLE
jgi:hypothetical protein